MIECDLKNKPKELLELNPYGKVPVLVDGDAVVYESAIINEYLEEKYPEVPLMPKDPLGRSRVRIWVDYCNTRLQYAGGTADAQPSALAAAAAGVVPAEVGEAAMYGDDEELSMPVPVETRHVDEREQIGRNDPCWCGSGKKFKKCHGA